MQDGEREDVTAGLRRIDISDWWFNNPTAVGLGASKICSGKPGNCKLISNDDEKEINTMVSRMSFVLLSV